MLAPGVVMCCRDPLGLGAEALVDRRREPPGERRQIGNFLDLIRTDDDSIVASFGARTTQEGFRVAVVPGAIEEAGGLAILSHALPCEVTNLSHQSLAGR